jgi:hypothetical protein
LTLSWCRIAVVHRLVTSLALLILLTPLTIGCADRNAADGGEEETGPPPGEAFAECIEEGDCFEDWCLHPAGEPGFCTYTCTNAANCEPAENGTAAPTCLPVEGDQVCALDCSNGKSCPSHMDCQQIEADGEARSICF